MPKKLSAQELEFSRQQKIRDLAEIKALYQLIKKLQRQSAGTTTPYSAIKKIGEYCHAIGWCEKDPNIIRNKHGYRNRFKTAANKRNTPPRSACLNFEALAQLRNLDSSSAAFAVWPAAPADIDYATLLNQLAFIWQQEAAVLPAERLTEIPAPSTADEKVAFQLADFASFAHDLAGLERITSTIQTLMETHYQTLDLSKKTNRYEIGYLFLMLGEAAKEISDLLRPEYHSKKAELNLSRYLFGKMADYRDRIKTAPHVVYGDPAHLTLMRRCLLEVAPPLLGLLEEMQLMLQQSIKEKQLHPDLLSGKSAGLTEKKHGQQFKDITHILSMGTRAFGKLDRLPELIAEAKSQLAKLQTEKGEAELKLAAEKAQAPAEKAGGAKSVIEGPIPKAVRKLLGLRKQLAKIPEKAEFYRGLQKRYFDRTKGRPGVPDPITAEYMEDMLNAYEDALAGPNPVDRLSKQVAKIETSIRKKLAAIAELKAELVSVTPYQDIVRQAKRAKADASLKKHHKLIVSAIRELELMRSILIRMEDAIKVHDNETLNQYFLAEKMCFGFLGQTYKELMDHKEALLAEGLFLTHSVFLEDIFKTIRIRHKQICHDMFTSNNLAIIQATEESLIPWLLELKSMGVLFRQESERRPTDIQDLPEMHRISVDPKKLSAPDQELYIVLIKIYALNRVLKSKKALATYYSIKLPARIDPHLAAQIHWQAGFAYRNLGKFEECTKMLILAQKSAKKIKNKAVRNKLLIAYLFDRAIAHAQIDQNKAAKSCLQAVLNFKKSSPKNRIVARIELACLNFSTEMMDYKFTHEIESIFQEGFYLLKDDTAHSMQLITNLLRIYLACRNFPAAGHAIALLDQLKKQMHELIPSQGQQISYHDIIQTILISEYKIYMALLQSNEKAELEAITNELTKSRKARGSFPYLMQADDDSATTLEAAILLQRKGYEYLVTEPDEATIEEFLSLAKGYLKDFCLTIIGKIVPEYHQKPRHKIELAKASYFDECYFYTAFISKFYSHAAHVAYRAGNRARAQQLMNQAILSKGLTHFLHYEFNKQWENTCGQYLFEHNMSRNHIPLVMLKIQIKMMAIAQSKVWANIFSINFGELREFSRKLHANSDSIHSQSPVGDYLKQHPSSQFFTIKIVPVVEAEAVARTKPSPKAKKLHSKQLGWNCFDIAINLEQRLQIAEEDAENRAMFARQELARRAIAESENVEYRRLLAPEIRHAAALTVTHMMMQDADSEGDLDNAKRIAELFQIQEALEPDDVRNKLFIEKGIIELLDKEQLPEEFPQGSLPKSLRTAEMRDLVIRYQRAHDDMLPTLRECNDALDRIEGNRMNLMELEQFFQDPSNQAGYATTYLNYQQRRLEILQPCEDAFLQYCERPDIYRAYVNDYYASIDDQGHMQWFAFQRNFTGERSTSMVDVTARLLQRRIVIHLPDGSELATQNPAADTLHVNYNGHNHFTMPPAAPVSAVSALRSGRKKDAATTKPATVAP